MVYMVYEIAFALNNQSNKNCLSTLLLLLLYYSLLFAFGRVAVARGVFFCIQILYLNLLGLLHSLAIFFSYYVVLLLPNTKTYFTHQYNTIRLLLFVCAYI